MAHIKWTEAVEAELFPFNTDATRLSYTDVSIRIYQSSTGLIQCLY